MQVCRYNDDRLGVVRGTQVHDVTALQSEIRAVCLEPRATRAAAISSMCFW